MDDQDQVGCVVCALNDAPGPVNGADIVELTDVVADGLAQIAYVLYRGLPLRTRVWWRLCEVWSERRGRNVEMEVCDVG